MRPVESDITRDPFQLWACHPMGGTRIGCDARQLVWLMRIFRVGVSESARALARSFLQWRGDYRSPFLRLACAWRSIWEENLVAHESIIFIVSAMISAPAFLILTAAVPWGAAILVVPPARSTSRCFGLMLGLVALRYAQEFRRARWRGCRTPCLDRRRQWCRCMGAFWGTLAQPPLLSHAILGAPGAAHPARCTEAADAPAGRGKAIQTCRQLILSR